MNISCIVDVASREVSFQENYKIASYDHNVDVIHFSVEPIKDFSLDTSSIKIAAQGPNNVRHDYAVDPATVQIEEETGYITFDWPIPAGVTEMPIGSGFKYGDKGQLIFSVCAEIISGSTLSKAWHSDDGIITVVAHLEPEAGGGEDPSETATNAQKIAQLQTNVAVVQRTVAAVANGTPPTASTIAEMDAETSTVYIYTGSESGESTGYWYYYNGTTFVPGGVYGGAVTSTTFNQHGVPADDFAVGEALADKADADDLTALTTVVAGKADSSDVTALDTRVTAVEGGIGETNERLGELKSAFIDESYYTQKKIGNIIEIIDERIHGSSQKWISDSGYHYDLYPISGSDAIVIKAQSGYSAYYQVLARADHTVGTTPQYATGYSGGEIKINGGASVNFTVPSDARYLMVSITGHQPAITVNGNNLYDMFSSENISLRVKTVEDKVTSIEVFDKTVETDLGLYVIIENERIHASSETWISDSGYLYNLYPIVGSDAIAIKAQSGHSAYYTLLKDSEHVIGTTPHYATGYSGGTQKINGGETASIITPSDAGYLMVDVASYSPTVTINGINTDDIFSNENMSKRVRTVEKKSSYVDENTYNITGNTSEDRQETSDISVLRDNLNSMLKYKNGLQSATRRINFSETSKKKQIFHIHRRANDGFDSGFNVYLPNAQKDFSDLRFISDTGKYLPYHFVYRGNIDILQDSRLGFDSKCRMYQNSYGTIISAVNSQIKTSDDNGETWTVVSALSSFDNPRVLGISTQDTLFFEKLGVLYRSAYPYTGYTEVYDHTAGKTGPAINGYGFVVHPSGPMFFGAYQLERVIEIYKSTDDGLNWTRVYYLEETYQHVHSMSVDVNQNPVAVYAGLDGGGGVLKTTDLGSTWTNLRELHPAMPQSTDYGVIGCGNGFRLLGGETPVVGGDSIIRTTDDSTFTPVLSIGNGFMRAEAINGRLFAGGTAANYFRNSEIMMSEDNGQTWTQVFTASDIREDGVTDGLKYVSKLHDVDSDEDYIVITCQHHTLPPVRIYSGGDNYYAEVIVDIPQGCNYVDVENGYLCQNRTIIGYDYQNNSAKIVDFGLNEGKCIKESVSGNIYRGDFNYINTGRYLDDIYPYIINPSDRYSIALESMIGSDFTLPQNFTTLDGITISFWFRAGSSIDVRLLTFGEHMLRFKNYTIYDGNTSFAVLRGIIFQNTLVKADIVIDFSNNKVKTFINGVKETDKTDATGLISLLAQYDGNVKYLNVLDCSHSDIMQHFTVYGSVLSDAEIKESYVCGVK